LTAIFVILACLVVANGLLSLAETAVVTSRKAKLQEWADKGDRSAQRALALKDQPQRFLALVQFWLTLSGMIAGVLGGVMLEPRFDVWLRTTWTGWETLGVATEVVSFSVVTIGLTAFVLVFGELAPKRVAHAYPDRVTCLLAGPVRTLAWLAAPFLKILGWATDAVLALVRFRPPAAGPEVSNEEVRELIEQGLHAGSFNRIEQEMVSGVLELDELRVTAIMTPRPKIVFLNLDDPDEVNWRKIVTSGHSKFPVFQANRDQVVGMVAVKAIWANSAFGLPTTLRNLVSPVLTVPATLRASQMLEQFRKSGQHLGLVVDEFGAVEGLVTLVDVLTAIVGDLPERGRQTQPEARRREDGSWLVDATLPTVDFKSLLDLERLPDEEHASYQTLAGFVMTQFGRIPRAGDHFDFCGWRFEVVDMDRQRIDKVLIAKLPAVPGGLEREAG
jgi:putative hemolysin